MPASGTQSAAAPPSAPSPPPNPREGSGSATDFQRVAPACRCEKQPLAEGVGQARGMKAEEDGATREGGGASKYRPQPGDGWVQCDCGQRHWGLHGAAGLLLLAAGAKRNQLLVALQHRAAWTHQGGTWGLPGGARQPAETAAQAAV